LDNFVSLADLLRKSERYGSDRPSQYFQAAIEEIALNGQDT
jgi:hypothetical protein